MCQRIAFFVLMIMATANTARAQWVVAGFFGSAATTRSDLVLTQPATQTSMRFQSVGWEGRSFRLPPYYGYRAAYFLRSPGWFGIEGGVIHMKVYALAADTVTASGTTGGVPGARPVRLDSVVQRFSLSHGQNMLLVNAVVRRALWRRGDYRAARLLVMSRVGIGPTLPHVESTIGGIGEERYERGALALQAAAGVEVRIWKPLRAVAEYKFTRCRQSVDTAAGSHIETLLVSHHLAFGLAVHV